MRTKRLNLAAALALTAALGMGNSAIAQTPDPATGMSTTTTTTAQDDGVDLGWLGLLGLIVPQALLLALGGVVLLGFAAYKVATRFRHPRWVGMRVGPRDLVLWSFLMATAHGAGLMLTPVLVGLRGEGTARALAHSGHEGHVGHVVQQSPGAAETLLPALAAVGLHSVAMLAVAGLIALVVYKTVGVDVLRRAWINLDLIWVGALAITGGLALGLGIWSL